MPKKRSHLHSTTSTDTRVRPVPSTQLSVSQIERELLLRDSRSRFVLSQRSGVITKRSASKSTDNAYFNRGNDVKLLPLPLPLAQHYPHEDRIYSKSRSTQGDTNFGVDSFHSTCTRLDEISAELLRPISLSPPKLSTNDENVNARRAGRTASRPRKLKYRDGSRRARVGRPRKVHRNVNCRVLSVPLRSVLKFSQPLTANWNRRRSWSRYSRSSSCEDKSQAASSSRDSSERDMSPSRYQVTPHPHEHRTSSRRRQRSERRETPRRRCSGSGDNSGNCSPSSEHNRHNGDAVTVVLGTASNSCRCAKCRGSKYQRSSSLSGHSRRHRSHSTGKRRNCSSTKERAKTMIERVKSAWHSPDASKSSSKRKPRSRPRSNSSRSGAHRAKRHKSRTSRSRSDSKNRRLKQKRKGGYLICRLM